MKNKKLSLYMVKEYGILQKDNKREKEKNPPNIIVRSK